MSPHQLRYVPVIAAVIVFVAILTHQAMLWTASSPCVQSFTNERGTWCYLTPEAESKEVGR